MIKASCSNCSEEYPEYGAPYKCDRCGGYYVIEDSGVYDIQRINYELPGMWRYMRMFDLPEDAPIVYLGEGDTPMVLGNFYGKDIVFKLEYLNPTGSFKDRGTALLISFLKSRGVSAAVEDSSGNAGASFAAYAARAGLQARVFIPEYTSGPKRNQIEAYGGKVIPVSGPRSAAAEAVMKAAKRGEVYASHAFFPIGIAGFSTVAYEIVEQLDTEPGTVITPVGQGSLLLGLARGFDRLLNAGEIQKKPTLVGVQALACAPLWAEFKYGEQGLGSATEGDTIAEGVRIEKPIRRDLILKMMKANHGEIIAVEERDIAFGQQQLAKLGFFVEPTSAIVWNALEQIGNELPEPIVVILTGSGLKSQYNY
jgi:threonine synthase